METNLRILTIGLLLCNFLCPVHAGDAQPPKQDPAKADPKKNEPPALSDGLRVSISTHFSEIKRKLADKSPAERRTAMPLLAEVKYEESGKLLVELALFDVDTEIRMEAFRQLCQFPDLEGRVAVQIALIFRKESNPWVKQTEANFMTRLPFKHPPLSELVRYIIAMKDPDNTVWDDQYDSQGGKIGGGGSGGRGSKSGRDHFTLIVQAMNAISGRNFPANRETSTQLAEWWKINEYDYQKADQELALKNRKDGMVGLNLVPPGAKSSVADTTAARNEQAAKAERAERVEKGKKLLQGILGEDEEEPAIKTTAKPASKPADKKATEPLTENDIE
jgi:hypothetical protein